MVIRLGGWSHCRHAVRDRMPQQPRRRRPRDWLDEVRSLRIARRPDRRQRVRVHHPSRVRSHCVLDVGSEAQLLLSRRRRHEPAHPDHPGRRGGVRVRPHPRAHSARAGARSGAGPAYRAAAEGGPGARRGRAGARAGALVGRGGARAPLARRRRCGGSRGGSPARRSAGSGEAEGSPERVALGRVHKLGIEVVFEELLRVPARTLRRQMNERLEEMPHE